MGDDSTDSEEDKYKPPPTSPCIVYMFGIDCDGRSVNLIVDDFTPFFFIEMNWVTPTVNRTDATRKLRFKMEKVCPVLAKINYMINFVKARKLGGFSPPRGEMGTECGSQLFWFAKVSLLGQTPCLPYIINSARKQNSREKFMKPWFHSRLNFVIQFVN